MLTKSAEPVPGQSIDEKRPRYRLAVDGSREGQWVDEVIAKGNTELREARRQRSEIWIDLPTEAEVHAAAEKRERTGDNGWQAVVGIFTRSLS